MKKRPTFSILLLCFVFNCTAAATTPGPISVLANHYTTISFFFPEKILKVIAPAPNFAFEFGLDSNMATLKADKGAPSNLTVITQNGQIYSFSLNYAKDISNFTYVLSPEESIGTLPVSGSGAKNQQAFPDTDAAMRPSLLTMDDGPQEITGLQDDEKLEDTHKQTVLPQFTNGAAGEASVAETDYATWDTTETTPDVHQGRGGMYEIDRLDYYAIFCENNYLQKHNFRDYGISVKEIGLQLTNILVDREEFYFVMDIQNSSLEAYTPGQLEFFVKTRVEGTKLPVEVLYTYNSPDSIAEGSTHRVVVVVKKFKLAPNQKVYAVLQEQDGGQPSVILPFKSEGINRR